MHNLFHKSGGVGAKIRVETCKISCLERVVNNHNDAAANVETADGIVSTKFLRLGIFQLVSRETSEIIYEVNDVSRETFETCKR